MGGGEGGRERDAIASLQRHASAAAACLRGIECVDVLVGRGKSEVPSKQRDINLFSRVRITVRVTHGGPTHVRPSERES